MALAAPAHPARAPVTRYAKSGHVYIAYQVVGDGPRDVVFVPGWASHVELGWTFPPFAHLLNRIVLFAATHPERTEALSCTERCQESVWTMRALLG